MWKIIKIIFTGVIFSFFYFPFEFTFLPGYNTKKILAVVGLIIAIFQLISRRDSKVPSNVFKVSLFAALVSLASLTSMVYNGTSDNTYARYILSMWVWLSAAYSACMIIRSVHGKMDFELLSNYIIGVCLVQCILSQIIDASPSFKSFVDTYVNQGQTFLTEVNRLYGIGANLDVAGSRFAVALILIACLLISNDKMSKQATWIYVLSYILIAVLGSIIARTTYVGAVVGVIYMILSAKPSNWNVSKRGVDIFWTVCILLVIAVPILTYLYNVSPQVHKMLRFAFEGFFNLVETGEWSISSNEALKTMVVFPETTKTWIIGDGYFNNPINSDPYFLGEVTGGYYMGTDVGYLRFIYYFGLIGLSTFILFFIKCAQYCAEGFHVSKWIFLSMLIANMAIWLKVSTDIFLVFAVFLCAANMQDEPEQIETDEGSL